MKTSYKTSFFTALTVLFFVIALPHVGFAQTGYGQATATNNTLTPIPDNNSTGAMHLLQVSGVPSGSVLLDVEVKLSLEHTWAGDLIAQVIAPDNSTICLFHRPGVPNTQFGHNANFVASSVIHFTESADVSSEDIGAGLLNADNIPSGSFYPSWTAGAGQNYPDYCGFEYFVDNYYGNINGNWRIRLIDTEADFTGSIVMSEITLTYDKYCVASLMSNDGLHITHVNFGDIENQTGAENHEGYYYLDQTTQVEPGETYPFSAEIAGSFNDAFLVVFIDWNQDGEFNIEDELIFNEQSFGSTSFLTNISIPDNAPLGQTRMRVMIGFNEGEGGVPYACVEGHGGEYEDYIIDVAILSSASHHLPTSINIWPNPATDNIRIQSIDPIESVKVYDVNGKGLIQMNPNASDNEFSVSELSYGIYLVEVKTSKGTTVEKLVKL